MKKSLLIIFLTFMLIIPASFLFAETTREYWNQYNASIKLNQNWKISIAPEFRCKEGLDNYHTHIDFGLDWKIRKWITMSAYYRHIFKKDGDRWDREYRPHFNVKFIKSFNQYVLSNRSRIELRFLNNDSSFRYRNKTSFQLPKLTALRLSPILEEELFYDFRVDEINKNRFYAGAEFPIFNKLSAVLYYLLESNKKEAKWDQINILKFDIKYQF